MTILGMIGQIFGMIPLETPKYEAIKTTQDYEVRKYPPCVAAQITYDPSQVKDTDDYGFDILAEYIGVKGKPKNTAPEKIAMTVPVITKPEKIAMTVPVITKPEKIAMTVPVVTEGEAMMMTIQFLLPGKYRTVEEAPRPVDERVEIKEVGERIYGVVRYRGVMKTLKGDVAVEKVDNLRKCLERDGYRVVGEAVLARYDPPWTLPFLRTNDIMFPIQ